MKNPIIATLLSTILCACASQPEDIKASYVSPNEYNSFSCKELEVEMRAISNKVSLLTGQLEKEANTDSVQMGVGLVLFWPALLFLEGGDGPEAAEYALLKGKYEAAETKYKDSQCQNFVEAKDETVVENAPEMN